MRAYLPLLALLAGCDLFVHHGDDAPCKPHDVHEDGYPSQSLRNPSTNQCEDFVQYPCDEGCGRSCGATISSVPGWGACESTCTDLDEATCLKTSSCQASYNVDVRVQDDAPVIYTGCWAVAAVGAAPGPGSCWGADAFQCAINDSCAGYFGFADGVDLGMPAHPSFIQCAPEPSLQGCELVDCGPGSHCVDYCMPCPPNALCACTPSCVPDAGCDAIKCDTGYTCVESCSGMAPTGCGAVPPAQCDAECVWTGDGDPGDCLGMIACGLAPPACPTGTVAGIRNGCWTGYCIPQADCGPHDPGTCEPAVCTTLGPACPTGTVGGTLNGCWTGYCIPEASCPRQTCEALTTEQACTTRGDCNAIYEGNDCTCDPSCTCQELTFDRCESLGPMPS